VSSPAFTGEGIASNVSADSTTDVWVLGGQHGGRGALQRLSGPALERPDLERHVRPPPLRVNHGALPDQRLGRGIQGCAGQ
jgi:hypothetical protein